MKKRSKKQDKTNTTNIYNGLSFTSLLALLFIALKLTGHLNWSWLWILSPLWLGWSILLVLIVGFLLIAFIIALIRTFK